MLACGRWPPSRPWHSYHAISYHAISYQAISYHTIRDVLPCDILHSEMSCHATSYNARIRDSLPSLVSYHAISYHAISYHAISYHAISDLRYPTMRYPTIQSDHLLYQVFNICDILPAISYHTTRDVLPCDILQCESPRYPSISCILPCDILPCDVLPYNPTYCTRSSKLG